MAKRGGFPGGMGGFGGMNINSLMKEAKKMQADLEKSQTELAAKEFEASAGGGAVFVPAENLGGKEARLLSQSIVHFLQDPGAGGEADQQGHPFAPL